MRGLRGTGGGGAGTSSRARRIPRAACEPRSSRDAPAKRSPAVVVPLRWQRRAVAVAPPGCIPCACARRTHAPHPPRTRNCTASSSVIRTVLQPRLPCVRAHHSSGAKLRCTTAGAMVQLGLARCGGLCRTRHSESHEPRTCCRKSDTEGPSRASLAFASDPVEIVADGITHCAWFGRAPTDDKRTEFACRHGEDGGQLCGKTRQRR